MSDSTAALEALHARAEKITRTHSLCAAQLAVARGGELLDFASFGRAGFEGWGRPAPREAPADERTLFFTYSVTKAVVSAACWILLQEGKLSLSDRVADYIPEFGSHGKDVVRVEQLLTHQAGFPEAPFVNTDWPDRERRLQTFADWQLEWEPGSRFTYHGRATLWLVAELITRLAAIDYRDFVRARIAQPLGLADFHIGLPAGENHRVADVVCVGEEMTREERSVSPVDAPVVSQELLAYANAPESRQAGAAEGGLIANAADVARFYQGILADAKGCGAGIWQPEMIRDACTVRSPELLDPMTQQPALRGLGVVLAGDEGKLWRGFGEACSPRAFGHMGAGGQVAWADPESELSFVFLTNGAHRNATRQGANGLALSNLAAACA